MRICLGVFVLRRNSGLLKLGEIKADLVIIEKALNGEGLLVWQ